MSPEIIIRLVLDERELEDTRKLFLQYGELRKFDEALGDFEQEMRELPGEYARPTGALLNAYCDKQPAGCVALHRLDDRICEMKRLFVIQDFRGQGIGRYLAEEILNLACLSGYRNMRLDTHPWMEAAQGLYRSLGFEEIEAYRHNPIAGVSFFELSL